MDSIEVFLREDWVRALRVEIVTHAIPSHGRVSKKSALIAFDVMVGMMTDVVSVHGASDQL